MTNYFYTTLKLKEKEKVNGKTTKSYEVAKTPYKRLMESDKISEKTKVRLRLKYKTLNPKQLLRQIVKLTSQL